MSLLELLLVRDPPSSQLPLQVLAIGVCCAPVALLPRQPALAVLLGCGAIMGTAVTLEPMQLLGAGLVVMVMAYGSAHWLPVQAWIWAGPLVVASSLVRDLNDPDISTGDAIVDLGFVAFAFGLGAEMRRRTRRAARLELDLEVADARMSDAIELERTRLARELHDIVAHSVSVMVVQAGTSRPLAERESPELAEVLATVETTGREALLELRRLLGVLRGEPLGLTDPMPRATDIPRLVERTRQTGMDIELSIGDLPHLSRGLDLCVYRIVQEGLTNALRHAPGSRVLVNVAANGHAVTVSVVDEGSSRTAVDGQGSGVGLIGLRERVTLFGGDLEAGRTSSGYQVRAVLPLVAAQEPVLAVRSTP